MLVGSRENDIGAGEGPGCDSNYDHHLNSYFDV